MKRGGAALVFAIILSLTAWTRVARFAEPLAGGELIALDGDSHYHVRRIEAALQGSIPTFDPLMNWPQGGIAHWADGFDVLGAVFALLAGWGRSHPRTDLAVFLWPVVLGILAVWATIDVSRRLVPRDDLATPLAAGLIAAFIPHLVDMSSLGRVDHHDAEALTMLLLLSWALRRFPVEGEGPTAIGWEAGGAAAVSLALWVFSGGEFYVALAAIPLGIAALGAGAHGRLVGSGAPALLAGAILGALCSVPAMRVHGRLLSFVFPSLLQPALVGTAGLALGAAVLAGRMSAARPPSRRLAAQLGAITALSVAMLAAVPGLGMEVWRAVEGWMLHRDPWIASIGEFQPLLRYGGEGETGLRHVHALLGPVGILGAVSVPFAVLAAWQHSPARAASYGMATLALSAMALLQLRFTRLAAPVLAIAVALALRGLATWTVRRTAWLAAWAPLIGAAVLVLASPSLRAQLVVAGPRDVSPLHQAALALRLDRAPVPGKRDGVLVPWDLGHAIVQLSGRPVVANGFGSYLDPHTFREVQEAFLGDEKRLVSTMEGHDLGFVIGGGHVLASHQGEPVGESPVEGDPPVLNPRFMRKTPLSQLLIAGSGMPGAGLPHLERLLPVDASKVTAGGLSFPLPVVWTYQLVPGARIAGRAGPGDLVIGELGLEEWGRKHRYRAWTRAGPDGQWQLRVAVPSGWSAHTIRTAPAWRITQGDGRAVDVEVSEAAVRGGSTIALP
jgi:asparagine N-glycosylation enzyme membrane subunit Stt3